MKARLRRHRTHRVAPLKRTGVDWVLIGIVVVGAVVMALAIVWQFSRRVA